MNSSPAGLKALHDQKPSGESTEAISYSPVNPYLCVKAQVHIQRATEP